MIGNLMSFLFVAFYGNKNYFIDKTHLVLQFAQVFILKILILIVIIIIKGVVIIIIKVEVLVNVVILLGKEFS